MREISLNHINNYFTVHERKKTTKYAIAHFEEWVIHKIHNVNLFLVKQKTISLLFKAEQKSSCQSKNVSMRCYGTI